MIGRRNIVVAVACAVMAGLLLVIIFSDKGLMELSRLQAAHRRLHAANADLVADNQRMRRIIDRLQNDAVFVEHVARQELGMVRADEVIFTFKPRPMLP